MATYNNDEGLRLELAVRGSVVMYGEPIERLASEYVLKAPGNQAAKDGSTHVVPSAWAANRRSRDGPRHHVSVLSKGDLDALKATTTATEALAACRKQLNFLEFFGVGLGSACEGASRCLHVVIVWPSWRKLRRSLGLVQADAHVTLGFENGCPQGVSRGLRTIVQVTALRESVANNALACAEALQSTSRSRSEAVVELHGAIALLLVGKEQQRRLALLECVAWGRAGDFHRSIEAADRVGDAASMGGYKGFALFKLGRYGEAHGWLLRADKTRAVERTLAACCIKLGLAPPLPLIVKFPRTPHLFDTGAATADDRIAKEALPCCLVSVEEKVDGANLGFSLGFNGEILVQNRSHYVCSADHAQFKPLDGFLREHGEALRRILQQDWILYGEWLVARHSIPYSRLPAYFVAFDLMDRSTGRFASRRRLHTLLKGSGICVSPQVCEPRSFGKNELEALLDSRSRFRDGTVEGVVVRVDAGDWCETRLKLVRHDFTAGIEQHWGSRPIEKQRLGDCVFLREYSETCYPFAAREVETIVLNPRVRAVVGTVSLMRNTSWLFEGEVLVSSTPKSADQIRALRRLNVSLVITLTEEEPLKREWFDAAVKNLYVPVPNYGPPSLEQVDEIVEEISRARGAVLIHCGGGKGRAGTVAACLLLRGATMSSSEAVAEIRRRRPGSIETTRQEAFVREYSRAIWKKKPADVKKQSKEQEGARRRLRRRAPKVIFLCGLPGSGKSTFAARIRDAYAHDNMLLVVANQDRLGRRECESLVGRVCGRLVLDRCNVTRADRREWLALCHNPPVSGCCVVFFDVDKETCKDRVAARTSHETIPMGRGGRVVDSFAKTLERPSLKEEPALSQVHVVTSIEESESLLASWGCAPPHHEEHDEDDEIQLPAPL